VSTTTRLGYFTRVVFARPGERVRIWSPADKAASPPLAIR